MLQLIIWENGSGDHSVRRIDIVDFDLTQSVKFNTSRYLYRDAQILEELRKDALLIQAGWEIEWVFEVSQGVSQPLLNDLAEAGIAVKIIEFTE